MCTSATGQDNTSLKSLHILKRSNGDHMKPPFQIMFLNVRCLSTCLLTTCLRVQQAGTAHGTNKLVHSMLTGSAIRFETNPGTPIWRHLSKTENANVHGTQWKNIYEESPQFYMPSFVKKSQPQGVHNKCRKTQNITTTCIKWAIHPFIHTPEGFPRVDDPILVQIEEGNVLLEHGVAMVLVPWGSMGVLSVHSLQRSWHICITTNNITLTQSEGYHIRIASFSFLPKKSQQQLLTNATAFCDIQSWRPICSLVSGEILGTISRDPRVSKCNRVHVDDIFRSFFTDLRHIQ